MKSRMSIFWWFVLYIAPCMALGAWLFGYFGIFFAMATCLFLVALIEPEAFSDESMYFWSRVISYEEEP